MLPNRNDLWKPLSCHWIVVRVLIQNRMLEVRSSLSCLSNDAQIALVCHQIVVQNAYAALHVEGESDAYVASA